jgi:hypothetical protein
VAYLASIEFDTERRTFVAKLTFSPESAAIDKTIIFKDVWQFNDIFDDPEEYKEDWIEQIIGLDEWSTMYVLKTDLREIIFYTEAIPEIVV